MKISFFYTPKPRQFNYNPRFYDPEREKFEDLKARYKLKNNYDEIPQADNGDLAYFQTKIKSFDRNKRNSNFNVGSLFKKKEMPKFNYKPRFAQDSETPTDDTASEKKESISSVDQISYTKKISFRRPIAYDREDESPMAEHIPTSKIIIYGIVIVILLLWILL